MTGPAPTPTAILKKRGSWRAKTRPLEPQLKLSKPRTPRGLSRKTKLRFKRIASDLFEMRVSSDKDDGPLVRYCQLFDHYDKLMAYIDEHGTTEVAPDGAVKTRPEFTQMLALSDALLRLEIQFGLTPSARSRLRVIGDSAKQSDRPNIRDFKIG